MRNVLRRSATLAAGLAVLVTSLVGFAGTANAGTYCAVKENGVRVYAKPNGNSSVINTLRKGPEVGCGSSSSQYFAIVHRLDNNRKLGYVRWSSLQKLG